MISICHEFAFKRNLKFDISENSVKKKIKFGRKSQKICNPPAPITLEGKHLPWVKKITCLGFTLVEDNLMRTDITVKRG